MASTIELLLLAQDQGWVTFTPTVYGGGGTTAISSSLLTYGNCAYCLRGNMCEAYAAVTVAGASSGATTTGGLGIALPVVGAVRQLNCGSAYAFTSGSATISGAQTNVAYMTGNMALVVFPSATTAFLNISANPAGSSVEIVYSVTYQI
jgi:hypothetical protein